MRSEGGCITHYPAGSGSLSRRWEMLRRCFVREMYVFMLIFKLVTR